MANDVELEVDTLEATRAALFDLDDASGIPYSLEPQLSPEEDLVEDLILDAEDVAAELVPDSPSRPPPPRPRARPKSTAVVSGMQPLAADTFLPTLVYRSTRPAPSEPYSPRSAAGVSTELTAALAEIARLQKQMRARDAYLAEIERALDASTRQLEAAGLGCVEDALRLLGRVRGQAFRIAELESELRQAQAGSPKSKAESRSRAKPRAARSRAG